MLRFSGNITSSSSPTVPNSNNSPRTTNTRPRRNTNELTIDLMSNPRKFTETHFTKRGKGQELNPLGETLDKINFKSARHIPQAIQLSEQHQSIRAMAPIAGLGPNKEAMAHLRRISDREARTSPKILAKALPFLRGKLLEPKVNF
jgi:hypothetical protein